MKATTIVQPMQTEAGLQVGCGGTANNVAGVTNAIVSTASSSTAAGTCTPLKSRNQNRLDKQQQQQDDKNETASNLKGKSPPKPPDEFYKDLQQFHEKRGTPIRNIPRITGNEVDLHRLYCEVTERGGFQKVNMRDEWDEVLPELGWKDKIVNGSAGLKYIYRRFLEKYERLNFFGEDPDKIDAIDGSDLNELIGSSASGRSNRGVSRYPSSVFGSSAAAMAAIHNVAMTYNYKQHHVNMDRRRQFKLSTDLHKSSPYEKLMLSLLSPLPNEQDFAINACTLMANESKHTLKINEYPKLMDALIAHTGVFSDYTMRKLFQHIYSGVRRHSLYGFWYDLLSDRPQILDLYTDEQAVRQGGLIDDWDDGKNYVEEGIWSDSRELDFLNLGRGLGTQDHVGQRVLQITSIVRNLSFSEENLQALVKNKTLLRFLVMSSNIRWNNVHIQALEITGNIAGELDLLDPSVDELSRCLMSTICEGIEGPDRGVIINCLEILYKLCQRDTNEDFIIKCLPPKFYTTIAMYLSLNDIMLLLFTLEAIYALTCLGAKSCHTMLQIKGIVDQLVSLISVEAQSYGPNGFILMRVVETVPGNMLPLVAQNIANLQNAAVIQKPNPHQYVSAPAALKTQNVSNIPIMAPEIEGPPGVTPVNVTASAQSVENSQQAQSQAQQIPQNFSHEDEQYAIAWLGATFERTSKTDCHIEQQELYRMYLSHCQKSGKHAVVNHVHFPRIVRFMFTMLVGPAIIRKPDGTELSGLHYVSIKQRAHPLPLQQKIAVQNSGINKPGENLTPNRKIKKKSKLTENIGQYLNPQNEAISITTDQVEGAKTDNLAPTTSNAVSVDTKFNTEPSRSSQGNMENKSIEKMDMEEADIKQIPEDQTTDTTIESMEPLINSDTLSAVSGNPSQSSLIKSLLANKVSQRQQKQKDIITTNSSHSVTSQTATSQTTMGSQTVSSQTVPTQQQSQHQQPIKVPSTAISALVNNPLMQNTSVKVGQTTIKPLNQQQISVEKKQIICESTPPPLAPLSGANVAKDASGRPIIINNQMLVDILDKKVLDPSIQKRKLDEAHLQNKRLAVEMPNAKKDISVTMPSKNAANLYAEMAASILEDEDLEEFSTPSSSTTNQQILVTEQQTLQQQQHTLILPSNVKQTSATPVSSLQNVQRQLVFQTNQPPQLKLTQTSAGTTTQQIPNAMATIKTDQGLQTVPVILHQKPMDGSQTQTQIIQQVMQQAAAPPTQTQYVLATNQQGQTYLVAQQTQPPPPPPTQQQTQTVLVTQTPQQQSTGAKTIIILQQQPQAPQQILTTSNTGQAQKMIMTTSQGQQVLLTQRPQTPQQIFINPQTGTASHIQTRQIIQTTPGNNNSQQQSTSQIQAGQISPSLLNQLNQIPATIKLHQPMTQSPSSARIGINKGCGVSILQGPPLPQTPSQSTTPVAIPQLQQHQSIIQQHIISGPSEKRHVILGGGRAIEIKETLITPAATPPLQTQLNSQTVIQQSASTATPLIQQQHHQTQKQVQQQIRAVLEQQQHPSIIQQKISTFNAITQQQQQALTHQATQQSHTHPQQSPVQVQVTMSTATNTTQAPVFLSAKVPDCGQPSMMHTKINTSQSLPPPQPCLPTVILPGGVSNNMSNIGKNLLPGGAPPLIKPSLPTVKLPPVVGNSLPPPPLAAVNSISTANTSQNSINNTLEKDNIKKDENRKTFLSTGTANTSTTTTTTCPPMSTAVTHSGTTSSVVNPSANAQSNSQMLVPSSAATTPSQQQASSVIAQPQLSVADAQWLYICDWRNCPRKKFKSLSDLQHHVCTAHAPDHLDTSAEIFCQWGIGPALCDGIPRKRFSLMTHLLDRHLIPDALRAAVQRRIATGMHNIAPTKPPVTIVRNIELSQRVNAESPSLCNNSSSSSSSQAGGAATTTIGSSALQAIKRHTAEIMNSKELMDENEGPVTKSIRLTAALILRNLVIYTTTAKKNIRRHEPHLANIALSNVESSGTISHILYEMNN